MATGERKVMDRGRTFARSKDQATAEGISMIKCPRCFGTRSSSGETYGPHRVWVANPDFLSFEESFVAIETSEPTSITGFPHEPLSIRVSCMNTLCHDGFQVRFHARHSVEEACVIECMRCVSRCDNGFQVMRIGQSAMMPVERKSVPFATMPKV